MIAVMMRMEILMVAMAVMLIEIMPLSFFSAEIITMATKIAKTRTLVMTWKPTSIAMITRYKI